MRETHAPTGRLSGSTIAFLVAAPLAWAGLLLFHPGGDGKHIYLDIKDDVTAWMVVHIGMMFFIPLMAVVVYVLLRGVDGLAARVSRIALVPFVIFYGTWEALQGIGNGILVHNVNELPAAERATGADLVQSFAENPLIRNLGVFGLIGSLAFITALIAAGIALHSHAGAPISAEVLLAFAAFLITAHPPPFGPVGLVLFVAAVVLIVRRQPGVQAAAPLAQPGPA